jgi:hypothetical protein
LAIASASRANRRGAAGGPAHEPDDERSQPGEAPEGAQEKLTLLARVEVEPEGLVTRLKGSGLEAPRRLPRPGRRRGRAAVQMRLFAFAWLIRASGPTPPISRNPNGQARPRAHRRGERRVAPRG